MGEVDEIFSLYKLFMQENQIIQFIEDSYKFYEKKIHDTPLLAYDFLLNFLDFLIKNKIYHLKFPWENNENDIVFRLILDLYFNLKWIFWMLGTGNYICSWTLLRRYLEVALNFWLIFDDKELVNSQLEKYRSQYYKFIKENNSNIWKSKNSKVSEIYDKYKDYSNTMPDKELEKNWYYDSKVNITELLKLVSLYSWSTITWYIYNSSNIKENINQKIYHLLSRYAHPNYMSICCHNLYETEDLSNGEIDKQYMTSILLTVYCLKKLFLICWFSDNVSLTILEKCMTLKND